MQAEPDGGGDGKAAMDQPQTDTGRAEEAQGDARDKTPRTERGRRTLRKLLDAAAVEFGERGFHEASISRSSRRRAVTMISLSPASVTPSSCARAGGAKAIIESALVARMARRSGRAKGRMKTLPCGGRPLVTPFGFLGLVLAKPRRIQ